MGFDDQQALLPPTPREFRGYRFLLEYFTFPECFLFVSVSSLQQAICRCEESELDLIFVFNRSQSQLSADLDVSCLNLFCTPAVNLFSKRADRIHMTPRTTEYHIVPDRTRPMDFEVYGV